MNTYLNHDYKFLNKNDNLNKNYKKNNPQKWQLNTIKKNNINNKNVTE